MRVFKSKWFARFARKERITDAKLCEAVKNAEQGAVDANLGGGVIKQRIARPNASKAGGYRSIILFRRGERYFFVYGFAKNALDNIDESDERDFKELANILLSATDTALDRLVEDGHYVEIPYDEQSEDV